MTAYTVYVDGRKVGIYCSKCKKDGSVNPDRDESWICGCDRIWRAKWHARAYEVTNDTE